MLDLLQAIGIIFIGLAVLSNQWHLRELRQRIEKLEQEKEQVRNWVVQITGALSTVEKVLRTKHDRS